MEPFVVAVTDRFHLGPRRTIAVSAMVGSANRLWRFDVAQDSFVVKELSHERTDQIDRRRRAAFERSVFEAASLAMPEPIVDRDGDIVTVVQGSRGEPCIVRVHRWMEGLRTPAVTSSIAATAGAALAVIHDHGASWSTERAGSLRWWDQDPRAVIDRLHESPLRDIASAATALASEAIALVAEAENTVGPWIYSHNDHKPQNALVVDGAVAVLDWDECGHCHPRLEAVESALRWAAESADMPGAFRAFLAAYAAAGTPIVDLSERDFGKWVAALLGWFSFQARRVLGDWASDAAFERRQAEAMARDAVAELERTLGSISTWASWA